MFYREMDSLGFMYAVVLAAGGTYGYVKSGKRNQTIVQWIQIISSDQNFRIVILWVTPTKFAVSKYFRIIENLFFQNVLLSNLHLIIVLFHIV